MDPLVFSDDLFGVWFLIGAALVFFMQAGFAMVETGFTRAKNAGNIIMKNLMDFSIGTVMFMLIGYAIMMSEDYIMGIIGMPNFQIFQDYANFPWSAFIFNLVFCATAATIVSGAMAERTKFSSYLLYSAALSAVVYPIEAGWVWNGQGWLCEMGFVDFAGSAAIHTVGGVSALIGVLFLGPRIGKYVTDPKTGKTIAKAFPGHNLTIGALGCFILWFGWYGFNGAAATYLNGVGGLASIFVTTTIAPAVAAVVTMFFTWIKNGKPDVSMTLNAALAGLVGITAGCATLDAFGATMVGAVAGILVVVAVEFIDIKLKIDDPVGAIAVHGVNGIWGTIAVGLFAVDGGLFYGGGADLLGIQCIGILAIIAWTAVIMTIVFALIKKFHGLRVTPEEELLGLDSTEHGLASSYADFMPLAMTAGTAPAAPAPESKPLVTVSSSKAIPVVNNSNPDAKITRISVITKQAKFEVLKNALESIGVTGMTVTQVLGCGMQKGQQEYYRGVPVEATLLPKVKVEVIICKVPVDVLVDTVKKALYTGNIGDGKIFVYDVENVIKVRTGEEGYDALQDEE
ncbi:MAG: ammonium transporter [Clostridia bacterium]